MIKINSVSKSFNSKYAVNNLTFGMPPNSIIGLLGPNGAGKTTLIRMLLDIIKPDDGEIIFNSKKISSEDKNKIGYLPEERGLYKSQSVIETLVYLSMLKELTKKEAINRAEYYLKKLDLFDYKDKKVTALSKGMLQKVQFIATIMFDPSLIILDEPFSGLDPINTRLMKDMINDLRTTETTIILSTHQMNQVEELCDIVLILNNGKEIVSGNLKEIREKYSHNEYLVETDADLTNLSTVSKISSDNSCKHRISLKEDFSSKDFLQEVLSGGYQLEHFEKLLMPLEDIFIKLVNEDVV